MSRRVELHATEADWIRLHHHLFPGDGDEHGAVLLCGTATTDRGERFLVHDVVLAVDGVPVLATVISIVIPPAGSSADAIVSLQVGDSQADQVATLVSTDQAVLVQLPSGGGR